MKHVWINPPPGLHLSRDAVLQHARLGVQAHVAGHYIEYEVHGEPCAGAVIGHDEDYEAQCHALLDLLLLQLPE